MKIFLFYYLIPALIFVEIILSSPIVEFEIDKNEAGLLVVASSNNVLSDAIIVSGSGSGDDGRVRPKSTMVRDFDEEDRLAAVDRDDKDGGDDVEIDVRPALHSCDFNETTCGWSTDRPASIKYQLPPPSHHANATTEPAIQAPSNMTVEEAQNFWRDFLFVNTSFSLTSPHFATGHTQDFHGGVVCVSFSARTSHWTKADLYLIYPTASPVLTRMIWQADGNPDESWTTYHIHLKLKPTEIQFRFSVGKSMYGYFTPHEPEEEDDIYFAIGFFTLEYGDCELEGNPTQMPPPDPVDEGEVFIYGDDKAVLSGTGMRWPGRVIPYEFTPGHFTDEQKSKIRVAMLDIQNRSCIHFVPHLKSAAYVHITGERGEGCYSGVGYSAGRTMTNFDTSSCFDMRTIRHELLHAVGFMHEHQRPDRDEYIDVLWENIKESLWAQFTKFSFGGTGLYSFPYDYESVMHYGTKTFSKNGQQTMRAKNPWARIGVSQTFSAIDTAEIRKHYDCDDLTPVWGDFCSTDIGQFKCNRFAPCELGTYACPSPKGYDKISRRCKLPKVVGEPCTDSEDFCSQDNAQCSSSTGLCVCKKGYYPGPKGDCIEQIATKRLGENCTNIYQCMYEMICNSTSKVCECPNFQIPIGDYGCVNKKLGSPCLSNRECSIAIPAAWCIDSVCQCPGAFYNDTYVDLTGEVQQTCVRKGVRRAKLGDACDTRNGYPCEGGGVCRTCPLSVTEVCTIPLEFGLSWNAFPDKPPGYRYVIAGSTQNSQKFEKIILTILFVKFVL